MAGGRSSDFVFSTEATWTLLSSAGQWSTSSTPPRRLSQGLVPSSSLRS